MPFEFLRIRGSVKPREISRPGPSAEEIETILTIGARVPDHGKITPWRFIVFEGDARPAPATSSPCLREQEPVGTAGGDRNRKAPVDGSAPGDRCGELHKATPQCAVMGAGVVGRASAMNIVTAAPRSATAQLADRLVRLRSRRARRARVKVGRKIRGLYSYRHADQAQQGPASSSPVGYRHPILAVRAFDLVTAGDGSKGPFDTPRRRPITPFPIF